MTVKASYTDSLCFELFFFHCAPFSIPIQLYKEKALEMGTSYPG